MNIYDSKSWFRKEAILTQAEIDQRVNRLNQLEAYEQRTIKGLLAGIVIVGLIVSIYSYTNETNLGQSIFLGFASALVSGCVLGFTALVTNTCSVFVTPDPVWLISINDNDYTRLRHLAKPLPDVSVIQRKDLCVLFTSLVHRYPEIRAYCARVIEKERPLLYGDYKLCLELQRDLDRAADEEYRQNAARKECAELHELIAK